MVGVGSDATEGGHNPIPGLHACDAGAGPKHDAGHFDAKRRGQGQLEALAEVAFTDFPVDAVYRGGLDRHQDLTGTRLGRGYAIDCQGFGAAIGLKT